MIYAVEQSAENLSGAFFLILVMIAMSFMAGFGLCFILLHRRRSTAAPGGTSNAAQQPPGSGTPDR